MTNFLAITIGNSRTRLGTFVNDELTGSLAIDNTAAIRDLGPTLTTAFEPLADNVEALVLLASVEPEVCRHVQRQVTETLGKQALRMEQDVPISVGRQLDPETIVGEDRLLNAAAAYDVLQQACVVIDAGTAMTVDFIDGSGTFHGGAIVPGAQMMLDALHERTAALPEIELNKPAEAIGHNTAEAMCTGVYNGLRGMVRGLVAPVAIGEPGAIGNLTEGVRVPRRDHTVFGLSLARSRELVGEVLQHAGEHHRLRIERVVGRRLLPQRIVGVELLCRCRLRPRRGDRGHQQQDTNANGASAIHRSISHQKMLLKVHMKR